MKIIRSNLPFVFSCALLVFGPASLLGANTNLARPNILIINADDMGFGDMQAYGNLMGTSSLIPTPRMDSLASQGMMFTQAHSCSGLCSPSRYGLLTGRYAWRLAGDGVFSAGIVGNYGQPIIRQGELTIAQFLKNQGYDTSGFGKWHIGAQWYDRQGNPYIGNGQTITNPTNIDLARRIEGHAVDQGFNHFFGAIASVNGQPLAYVVDDYLTFNGVKATTNTPWVLIPSASLVQGADTIGDPNLTQPQFGPDMIARATNYLASRITNSQPFFAYVALYSPHLPLMPSPEFVGSCGISNFAYGDYMFQTDYWIGQLLDSLGANSNNTIVIFTSDNGPENGGPFGQSLGVGHDSNGPLRGVKRDGWEGGHRVPFVVRWPGKVSPGSISSNLLWQGDVFATVAAYLETNLPAGQAPDSQSFLHVLRNTPAPPTNRDSIVTASSDYQLSLHMADGWKLLDGTGSGGYDTTYDADNVKITNSHGVIGATPKQLFFMPSDIGERTNLQAGNPSKVNELMSRLTVYRTTSTSIIPSPDNDADGIPNYWEQQYGLNLNNPNDATNRPPADPSLTYLQKYLYGLSPLVTDSDSDGLSDYAEIFTHNSNPALADGDGDGISDVNELFVYGTNPSQTDTDGDGVMDGVELTLFSNPRNAAVVPTIPASTVLEFLPVQSQVVAVFGTTNDPAISSNSWSGGTTLFVRERASAANDAANQYLRSRLFVKFNLSGFTNVFENARMRVYQVDRLNSNVSSPGLEMGRVLATWGTNAGTYPLFDTTPVTNLFNFGNTADFGTAKTSAGFYSGTPGVVGTNDLGFDPNGNVSLIVSNWISGAATNHGLRLDILDRVASGAAFAVTDNAATTGQNERFALLVTSHAPASNFDADHDGMRDADELSLFGNLSRNGLGDFDNDGVVDRIELALGSDSKSLASRPEFKLQLSGNGNLLLTFQRSRLSAAGYQIEISPDLQNWTPHLGFFALNSTQDLGNGYERVTFTATPQGVTLFMRLKLVFP